MSAGEGDVVTAGGSSVEEIDIVLDGEGARNNVGGG
jgi:orotate phosphoribosyltransferase